MEISGKATGADGLRQPSDVILTINDDDKAPGMPTGFTATPGATLGEGVDLKWTAPAMGQVDGEDVETVYEYQFKLNSQVEFGDWQSINGENVADGTVTIEGLETGLVPGALYQFRVRAKAGINGPASDSSASDDVRVPAT